MGTLTMATERTFIMIKPDGVQRGLMGYMASGPVCAMVWEGLNAVKTGRVMLGETNPAASLPGTIRGDFAIHVGRNICHGSGAVESANHEIALWFKPEELCDWTSAQKTGSTSRSIFSIFWRSFELCVTIRTTLLGP